ncbi:MAG: hypothetical protein AB1298_00350 [Bacteroidota bacterium]
MKNLIVVSFLLLSVASNSLIAHKGEDHKKMKMGKPDTLTIVDGDTIAINGYPKSAADKMQGMTQEEMNPPKAEEKFELKPFEATFQHLHNKVIHFPIVIGVFAFLFSVMHLKWKNQDRVILIMVAAGFLFSIVAYFTGNSQSEPFIGTGKEWVVNLHRNFGISVLALYFIWLLFLFIAKIKKYAWIIGAILFLIVSITGFLGGVIAH